MILSSIVVFLALVLSPHIAWATNTFPNTQAEDLNGKAYSLPQELPAQRTLLLIAFKREQQQDINTWIDGLELKNSSTPWLELPVLEDYGSWFKWFVDNGMRKGIKAEYDRAKVVTVYTNKEEFNSQIGIMSEETIYAAVVSSQGEILGMQKGLFDPEKAKPLMDLITQTTMF